jgi:AhpC/TSA family protein
MTNLRRFGLLLIALALGGGTAGASPGVEAVHGVPTAQTLDGRPVDPFDTHAKAIVLIFVSTDCPIANRYAPEIERLYEMYAGKHVAFWLVYADAHESVEKIRTHLHDYQYKVGALRDPQHRLVKRCGAKRTPEAALFTAQGKEVYRGRIDDRFTDFGKWRSEPSRRDLKEALDAVLAGRPVKVSTTKVIGCYIPDLDP